MHHLGEIDNVNLLWSNIHAGSMMLLLENGLLSFLFLLSGLVNYCVHHWQLYDMVVIFRN